jgi:hypothetical protein
MPDKSIFQPPDIDKDREALDDAKKGAVDFDKIFYRPTSQEKLKKGEENIIRILPSTNPKAGWHLRAAKHFVKHPDRTESFICMNETYGGECPACERMEELKSEGDKDEAAKWRPKRFGVFNVIDRMNPQDGPKIYECPVRAVWQKVVSLVVGQGRMSNIFDEYDKKGNVESEGRDILIVYNSNAHPQDMYAVMPMDPSPLSDEEEDVDKWINQIRDLILEEMYPPIEYEDAHTKCFGSEEEREELRKQRAEEMQEKREKEDKKQKEEDEEEPGEDEKENDLMARAKKAKEDLKKKKKKEKKEEEEEEDEASEEDSEEDVESEEEEPEKEEKPKKKKTARKKKEEDGEEDKPDDAGAVISMIQNRVDQIRGDK